MQKIGHPIPAKSFYAEVASKQGLSQAATLACLEISKRIQSDKEGKLGLIEWPEIKPRGVKDKAFLVFKKHGKPLHFTDVAKLIDKFDYNMPNKKTYPQTVHNELIKDARFVLVGRGTYALSEWGFVPGTIKDIITKVLKEKNEPTHKDEVVKKVLAQRLVAKNTVLMNLNNKNHFDKDSDDKYFIRETA
jgi:DNA-directed RNA polymerase delta subunit